MTSRIFTGVFGSSLVMTSSQALGHLSVALYRIKTLRHEPGCSVAGNGLLINFQCLLLRLNATLNTCSLQSPTLQIAIVRSPRQPSFTPPMHVEPVTTSFPEGTFPETAMLFGPVGSSLVTVIVPDFVPKLAGSKRIRTSTAVPGAIRIGYARTFGTTNSLAEDAMFETVNVHGPLFNNVRGLSRNDPMHTLPNLPALAIIKSNSGGGAVPETVTMRGLQGSLLITVRLAALAPKLVGWNRIGSATESPEPTRMGYETTAGTRNSAEDEMMFSTRSGHRPLLLIVR